MKILVTGANGFLGSAVTQKLTNENVQIVRAVRDGGPDDVSIGDINDDTDWGVDLIGVDCIVHCAARVHVMSEVSLESLFEFRQVNVGGTLNLARQAAEAGVPRFVFISSIKVNGESTHPGHPFTADQIPAPIDPYGVSKYEAEIGLMALSEKSGMEIVIIRPPLVYGPGVKANFLSMMNWLWRGFPLPLGSLRKNRRSFIFIDNLVSVIIACINHPAASNQIFLVSDDEDLTTSGLLERMALALGRPSRLIALPSTLIILLSKLVGKPDIALRLCGSLQVDIKKAKDLLGWSPPFSVDEGLRQTAAHFKKNHT